MKIPVYKKLIDYNFISDYIKKIDNKRVDTLNYQLDYKVILNNNKRKNRTN